MAHLPLFGIEAEQILGLFLVANAKVVVPVRGRAVQRGGTQTLRLCVCVVLLEGEFVDRAADVREVGWACREQLAFRQGCKRCTWIDAERLQISTIVEVLSEEGRAAGYVRAMGLPDAGEGVQPAGSGGGTTSSSTMCDIYSNVEKVRRGNCESERDCRRLACTENSVRGSPAQRWQVVT